MEGTGQMTFCPKFQTSGACDLLCSVDKMSSPDYVANYRLKTNLLKTIALGTFAAAGAATIGDSWVFKHQTLAMSLAFFLGYAGIIFEELLAFNKSGVALLMAVTLWTIHSRAASPDIAVQHLSNSFKEVGEILFFLLGAMAIVEIVKEYQGFKLVTNLISTRNPRRLLWVVGGITFVVSSVLDNLASTIVMVSLLQKLVLDTEQRKFLGAVVVIAANAGGAWTPIGDVTTTMLWINGRISTFRTMQDLFLPSVISLAVPLALMSIFRFSDKGTKEREPLLTSKQMTLLTSEEMAPQGHLVFGIGIGTLLFVPIFKSLTGLPPYLGMLFGLGVLWILTDAIHFDDLEHQNLKVPRALSRVDIQGVLFFLGILLSVGSLKSAGILQELAAYLDAHIPRIELTAAAIGLATALLDSVPLVAAAMEMYSISTFPTDSQLWQLVAYCAGTGGSLLIMGSAAGVTFMGIERASFLWYFKKVSAFALAGYAAGLATYLAVIYTRGFQ
ncbi:hypothetical protein O6H91_03G038900 [Diphasiastrum complanatum]|uniref:Uncharacterized protein n=1 Tax=Diphasiastrum complanatum TaxID=34168 RepID=A0ACC2E5F4_DIPCM|nr:hypothetical protein O6H91_03G038900 [Diphasiastrum complanatum]